MYDAKTILLLLICIQLIVIVFRLFRMKKKETETETKIEAGAQIEPFTRKFLQQKQKIYTMIVPDIKDNNYNVVKEIDKLTSFKIDIIKESDNFITYDLIQKDDAQFAFTDTNTLYRMFNTGLSDEQIQRRIVEKDNSMINKYPDIRFIACFHDAYITVLTHRIELFEFNFLKNSYRRLNIGKQYSNGYFSALILINYFELTVIPDTVSVEEARLNKSGDIYVSMYDNDELLEHYGSKVSGFHGSEAELLGGTAGLASSLDINDTYDKNGETKIVPDTVEPYVDVAIFLGTHPDDIIYRLSEKRLSRFTNLTKINDGNIYHITLEETPFYDKYPYYHKALVRKTDILNNYPKIDLYNFWYNNAFQTYDDDRLNLFVNTLSIKYNLIGNRFIDNTLITQMLMNLSNNLPYINKYDFIADKITTVSFANYELDIPIAHEGSKDFFYRAGLYTNIDNPNCTAIDGRCTYDKLYKAGFLDNNYTPEPKQLSTEAQAIQYAGEMGYGISGRLPTVKNAYEVRT